MNRLSGLYIKSNRKASDLPVAFILYLFFPVLCLVSYSASAQQSITVFGKAMDKNTPSLLLEQVMVVNLRTQQGVFGNSDNSFSVSILKTDTLVVTAIGYNPEKICFNDSTYSTSYKIVVGLKRLSRTYDEVTIMAPRDLNRIEEDIKKLGYRKSDYRLTGLDAWRSPLTALYEEFSRRERSRRKVAQLMNEDERRKLLREVLANYSRSGLIKLQYHEYNAFIDYLGISEFLLKSFSQYELAVYIKNKYLAYSNQ
ncbi:MAG: hypothetical protein U0Y08_15675 [Bacteroidia bacterium]